MFWIFCQLRKEVSFIIEFVFKSDLHFQRLSLASETGTFTDGKVKNSNYARDTVGMGAFGDTAQPQALTLWSSGLTLSASAHLGA
jgi:hypothetical protein